MKKIFFLFLISFLFLSKSFSKEDYLTGALGIDFSYNLIDNEFAEFPFMPGLFISWNNYGDFRKVGFHFDANVLGIYNNDDKDNDATMLFSFSSLIGPSFRFGSKTVMILSPGWSFGTRFGDMPDSKDKKITDSYFQVFTGPGVNIEFLFTSKFAIQVPVNYYPFCHSSCSKYKNNLKIESIKNNRPMIKIGIFLGMWT